MRPGPANLYLLMRFDRRTYAVVRDGIWQSVQRLDSLMRKDYVCFACYKRVWRPIP
jgi:hypothetical protein